jgi:hypothetical protein
MKNTAFLLLPLLGCASEVAAPTVEPSSVTAGLTNGERLEHGCPSGETCAAGFAGASFSGSLDIFAGELAVTAVGGTQRVSVAAFEGDLEHLALSVEPIELASSDPSVLEIESTRSVLDRALAWQTNLPERTVFPQAMVRFVRRGEAFLLVVAADGTLIDRIAMSGRDTAGVTASASLSSPSNTISVLGFDAQGEILVDRDFTVNAPIALRAERDCYFCLTGEADLVDQPLAIVFGGREWNVVVTR